MWSNENCTANTVIYGINIKNISTFFIFYNACIQIINYIFNSNHDVATDSVKLSLRYTLETLS